MKPLPYDYTRCANETCALRDKCRRTTPGQERYKVFIYYPGGEDCRGLIEESDK
ncbi:MAG: hypothetical protein ACRCWF_03010 [Beijerinckiaceae bacterium]